MNYALDALWWELKEPEVRDLAVLLVAPSPWRTGMELPVSTLLGATGFRFLLQLEQQPEALHVFLAEQPAIFRLGLYAEHLLMFWFSHAPHCQLLARNFAINENGRTLGALDFLVLINDVPFHLELTCKYYGGRSQKLDEFVGLDTDDVLLDKVEKIKHQLSLSIHDDVTALAQKHGIKAFQAASIVRGNLFVLSGNIQVLDDSVLNPYGWHGALIDDVEDLAEFQEARFAKLSPLHLLAPARVSLDESLGFDEISGGIFALLQLRFDGFYHEVQRFMVGEG